MKKLTTDEFEADAPQDTAHTPEVVAAAPAVDFSDLKPKDRAALGLELEEQIQDDSKQVMARYLRIGRNLFLISKHKLYEQMGHSSFEEWRAQPELNLARSTSYALMKIFDVFVERLRVSPDRLSGLDWSKLFAICAVVTPENVDEYLEKVRLLSRSDLQSELSLTKAIAGGKTQTEAETQQVILGVIREACPIGCGGKCPQIAVDEDAAVVAFKHFLGGWRGLQLKVKGLFATMLQASNNSATRAQQHEPATDEDATEAVPPAPVGPTSDDFS